MNERFKQKYRALVIGASSGGLAAITSILYGLPERLPFAVVIVLHRSRESSTLLEKSLDGKLGFPVKQAYDKQPIETGTVYFAPPDYHLLVEDDRTFALSTDAPVSYSRPSVDVLFESAAEVYGPQLIGMVLTGANQDGSRGLARVRDLGGVTMVQDPVSATSRIMPQSAIEAVSPKYILSLENMPHLLVELGREP